MKHFICILCVIFISFLKSNAQSPGNVSSNLMLWLRAEDFSSSPWLPKTVTPANTTFSLNSGGNNPSKSVALNFNPTLKFNGSSYFEANNVTTSSIVESFAVVKTVSGTSYDRVSGAIVGTKESVPDDNYQYLFHVEVGNIYIAGNAKSSYWSTNQYVNTTKNLLCI